ncbi:MAG: hypothetical protein JWQ78_252 [Sediminibacterium sp.]|nr:hypothetical protein [Sediminibacterium sp.]
MNQVIVNSRGKQGRFGIVCDPLSSSVPLC